MLEFIPSKFLNYSSISKHTIQGMIYSLLTDSEFKELHNKRGFKYFTFSDIFPTNDYYPEKPKKLIISSPNKKLIEIMYNKLKRKEEIYIKNIPFKLKSVKKFDLSNSGNWISGSPIILYLDNKLDMYFSFKRGSIYFFLRRLKENSITKYNAFYNEDISLNEPIFDSLELKKEVSIKMSINGKNFIIIGSVWNYLHKRIPKGYGKFYKFLMDCGLGEKNSLGFGFINPIKVMKNGVK